MWSDTGKKLALTWIFRCIHTWVIKEQKQNLLCKEWVHHPIFHICFKNLSPESTYAFNDLAGMAKANHVYVNIVTVKKYEISKSPCLCSATALHLCESTFTFTNEGRHYECKVIVLSLVMTIFIMGISLLLRWHLYIQTVSSFPWFTPVICPPSPSPVSVCVCVCSHVEMTTGDRSSPGVIPAAWHGIGQQISSATRLGVVDLAG